MIIFEMFNLIFSNTLQTTIDIFGLFVDLINSVAYIMSVAGPAGYIIALGILVPSIYVISKFFTGSLKTILIAGVVVFFVLIIFASIA